MKKKNKWLIYSPEKFSNGQKAFNMILASQKYIFFIKKKKMGYKTHKNEIYYKNYFVQEASSINPYTICNFLWEMRTH